jgi:holo-[acyl-carrier protein] synthase
MIAGIGIDIIDVNRIRKVLERNPAFRQKVFSDQEISYCDSKKDPAMSYAARFAAKEAFMKALGTGWNHEVRWVEIETVSDGEQAPYLVVSGLTEQTMLSKKISRCHLSLSHEKEYAIASVVLENHEP